MQVASSVPVIARLRPITSASCGVAQSATCTSFWSSAGIVTMQSPAWSRVQCTVRSPEPAASGVAVSDDSASDSGVSFDADCAPHPTSSARMAAAMSGEVAGAARSSRAV